MAGSPGAPSSAADRRSYLPIALVNGAVLAALLAFGWFVLYDAGDSEADPPVQSAASQAPLRRDATPITVATRMTVAQDEHLPRRVYIVGSPNAAAILAAELALVASRREDDGLEPIRAEILVVESPGEAAALRDALLHGNEILAALGQLDEVYDLTE